jgi:hypothetical protein
MFEHILYNVPERWRDLVELIAAPLSSTPQMQDVRGAHRRTGEQRPEDVSHDP